MNLDVVEDFALVKIKDALGNKVRGYGTLPGQWDEDTLKRVLLALPGVFLSWGGIDIPTARNSGTAGMVDSTWIVYVATTNAGGAVKRARGDALEVGAYELIKVLVPLLNGMTVPGEGTFNLRRVENLFKGTVEKQGVALYAITFVMPVGLPTTVDEAELDDFRTFDAQYDLTPFVSDAERQKWLDDDYATSKPEARDTVSLSQ